MAGDTDDGVFPVNPLIGWTHEKVVKYYVRSLEHRSSLQQADSMVFGGSKMIYGMDVITELLLAGVVQVVQDGIPMLELASDYEEKLDSFLMETLL